MHNNSDLETTRFFILFFYNFLSINIFNLKIIDKKLHPNIVDINSIEAFDSNINFIKNDQRIKKLWKIDQVKAFEAKGEDILKYLNELKIGKRMFKTNPYIDEKYFDNLVGMEKILEPEKFENYLITFEPFLLELSKEKNVSKEQKDTLKRYVDFLRNYNWKIAQMHKQFRQINAEKNHSY